MTLAVDLTASFTASGTEPFTVDVEFLVEDGETLVVLGPSGSGKTLLLETIAGFHHHEGTVVNGGRDLTGMAPEKREFGYVFQDYALFPHMTVRENVDFGTRYHEETRDAEEVLEELGVADLAERSPQTLSGGECQRVALARSLAVCPSALLLDEPLASLDVPTRQQLRDDLVALLDGITTVYVTHNRTTARALADRVAVMRNGELVQIDTPENVFERPASPFVARFTGANCLRIETIPTLGDRLDAGDATHLAVRPEHIALDPATPDVEAEVTRVVREDATNRVVLAVDEGLLEAFASQSPTVGAVVGVGLPREHVALF